MRLEGRSVYIKLGGNAHAGCEHESESETGAGSRSQGVLQQGRRMESGERDRTDVLRAGSYVMQIAMVRVYVQRNGRGGGRETQVSAAEWGAGREVGGGGCVVLGVTELVSDGAAVVMRWRPIASGLFFD